MSNDLLRNSGFTLDFFQFYNWGTFNNKIYTLNADNNSTVLIGDNGSGKTTLVDALLTLLVPNEKRYYNQSSGETSKKDRSEDTYVLGAYGNKLSDKDEGGRYEVHNYHRKKENTISILNGCFTNVLENRSYTLLQIRYYTASALNQVYAITPGKVTIENLHETLQKQGVELIKNKKWKDILSGTFGTQFYPSFKQYSSAYSGLFGLRSDKALKLFSQIVGLKVLGDIDSFIKYSMLEEGNTLKEYENLQDNYKTLVHCSNEIKKTKVQIEKFKIVNDNGEKYKEESIKKDELQTLNDVLPYHYTKNANTFLIDEKEKLNIELSKAQKTEEKSKENIRALEEEIASINNSITNNSNFIRLQEIENTITSLTKEMGVRSAKREDYAFIIEDLKLSLPENEKDFNNNIDKIKAKEEKEKQNEENNAEEIRQLKNNIEKVNNNLGDIKKELESLGQRDSNIPFSNIEMRENICQAVKCDTEDIPFAGELIEVKEEEGYWKKAIEKVLHNVALTLLVPPHLYKKVSTYVNDNNMKGRVVYLQADDTLNYFDGEILFDDNTVGTKLNFKESNANIAFLKGYIKDNFSYICASSINEYSKYKKAVTANGLIKNGLKNEKDDRAERNGRNFYVLGWSNKEKKLQLSKEYDTLDKEKKELLSKVEVCEGKKLKIRNTQNFCHDALNVDNYDLIDVETIAQRINSEEKEKKALLESNKDLELLKSSLEEKKREKSKEEDLRSSTDRYIGRITSKLEECEKEFERINKTQLEFTDEVNDAIEKLKKAYPRLSNPKNYEDLKSSNESMQKSITNDLNATSGRIKGYTLAVIKAMGDAITPSAKLRETYGDWSIEFPDLMPQIEYLDDFIKVYNRLIKDDLPKYTKQFHEYLHTSLQDDFTNFQGCIRNQQKDIQKAIDALNAELSRITYDQEQNTYLILLKNSKIDSDIKVFNRLLKEAIPNAFDLAQDNPEKEEEQFEKIQKLLNTLSEDERFKKKVLDIRNWFTYGASERKREGDEELHYYTSSSSISGGEKTKLTYTIVGAAISYQFGIAANEENKPSFRFVIIDEAFSKIDPKNSVKVMEILKELEIQIMAVTPDNNLDIIQDYIQSIHLVTKDSNFNSKLHHLGIREYKENKDDFITRAKEESI